MMGWSTRTSDLRVEALQLLFLHILGQPCLHGIIVLHTTRRGGNEWTAAILGRALPAAIPPALPQIDIVCTHSSSQPLANVRCSNQHVPTTTFNHNPSGSMQATVARSMQTLTASAGPDASQGATAAASAAASAERRGSAA